MFRDLVGKCEFVEVSLLRELARREEVLEDDGLDLRHSMSRYEEGLLWWFDMMRLM